MAGESARESARKQREKAQRLARSAELWERGADGEEATAAALAALPAAEWTVFHDIRWPGRRYANIDHVAVGPGGVFVIDSKNWTGRITVDDDVLRQNGRSREKAVAGAAEAALAIMPAAAVLDVRNVAPVICFVRDEAIVGWARDVMVCATDNLVTMLASRPRVMSPEEVRTVAQHLDVQFRQAADAARRGAQVDRSVPDPRPEPVAAERVRPQPPRPSPRSRARSRKRRSLTAADWARLVFAVVFLGLLLTKPGLLGAGADWITDQFFG